MHIRGSVEDNSQYILDSKYRQMQLIAIHVEDHKALKGLTFSFDHRFEISFCNGVLKIASLNRNNHQYYGSNISVNLLLGTNGVGKSTLLEIVEDVFNGRGFFGFHIWLVDGELILCDQYSLVHTCGSDDCKIYNKSWNDIRNYQCVKLLKLGNVIDLNSYAISKSIKKSRTDFLDLSSNRIIRSSKKKIIKDDIEREIDFMINLYKSKDSNTVPSFVFKVEAYDFKDFFRILNLVDEKVLNVLLDKNGEYRFLRDWLDLNHIMSHDKQYKFYSKKQSGMGSNVSNFNFGLLGGNLFKILKNRIDYFYANADDLHFWFEMAEVGRFLSMSETLGRVANIDVDEKIGIFLIEYVYHVFEGKIKPSSAINNLCLTYRGDFFDELRYEFEEYCINKYKPIGSYDLFVLDSILGPEWRYSKNKEGLNVRGNLLTISLNDGDSIIKLIDFITSNAKSLNDFVSFGWSGLSSGEEAKIKLLSRLSNGLNKLITYGFERELKSIFVIIDEVDLYLNPEWQREIISDLIDVAMKVSNTEINIHFIITSHSPIIASDILPYDIIYMKKKDEKIYIDKSVKGFGASISELYFESFNCDSTLGKLSRTKIDDLIEKSKDGLNNTDVDIVSLIGNDFLKNELLKRAKK